MLRSLLKSLARIGRPPGMTFRTVAEEGVGLFVVPNPRPRRQTLTGRVSGAWTPKLLHFVE